MAELNGTLSKRKSYPNVFTKDRQRFLEKTWITLQFGLDVFEQKHPHHLTLTLADFCFAVETKNILQKLKFCHTENCRNDSEQQISNFFIA